LPEESTSIPIIPPRPTRQSLDSDRSVEHPTIPSRPAKRPERHHDQGHQEQIDHPTIPQRPSRRVSAEHSDPAPHDIDDYLIDGIEKRVPLLPADETQTGEDLTPSLSEIISVQVPNIPRRPMRRESLESRGSEDRHAEDPDIPMIPRRPGRKLSTDIHTDELEDEHPVIPQRPSRNTSVEHKDEPVIPRRPSQRSQKSVEEEHPTIPQRPVRRSSIKSQKSEDGNEPEPIIPARPRRSSIKSIPESENPELEEPVIPVRPNRTLSIKSIPDVTSPEIVPVIPQRPTRKSSVKSFKSQHSIEEQSELEKIPGITSKSAEPSIPERQESLPLVEEPSHIDETPSIPSRPGKVDESIHAEPMVEAVTAPPIEEIPTSPHQHPTIPVTKEDEPLTEAAIPIIPTQPKKEKETGIPLPSDEHPQIQHPEQRLAGYAALTSTPVIPPRPTKSKPKPIEDHPQKVAMDQTPEIIHTEGRQFESDNDPISSTRKHHLPTPGLDPHTSLILKEYKTPSSEIQTEISSKPTESEHAKPVHRLGVKSPPIPARPMHKLAKQFEVVAPPVKEKPIPPPRPVKPLGSSKFAGLRAQFAQSLNEKLAKPAPALPTRKEEEVHSMEPETHAEVEKTSEEKKVGDVRKGRARGPQRRPPTVKPIIPTGWGISTIATVFEQPVVNEIENAEEVEDSGSVKSEVQTQTGELIIESERGVKTVYVEGGVVPGGHGVTHVVVPNELSRKEELVTHEVLPHEDELHREVAEVPMDTAEEVHEKEISREVGETRNEKDDPVVEPLHEEIREHAEELGAEKDEAE
jgi:hypothetical protein